MSDEKEQKEQVSQENIPLEGKYYELLDLGYFLAKLKVENLGRVNLGYGLKPMIRLHYEVKGPSGRTVPVNDIYHNTRSRTGKLYPVIQAAYGEPGPDFNVAELNGRMVLIKNGHRLDKRNPNLKYNDILEVLPPDAERETVSSKHAQLEADIKRIAEKQDAQASRGNGKARHKKEDPPITITDADLPENLR